MLSFIHSCIVHRRKELPVGNEPRTLKTQAPMINAPALVSPAEKLKNEESKMRPRNNRSGFTVP